MTHLYLKCCILFLVWQSASTETDCEQELLGSWVHLRCPPGHEPTLGYCCNYNGKISCCSYEDFSLMHGHGTEAVICLIVTGSLTVVILVVLFYMRCRDKGVAEENMKENLQESNSCPIPTIVVSPSESVQNTVHSRQSLQNTVHSTQSWSSCRYAEVLQNIFREDEEREKRSSAVKKVSFAGIYE